MRSLLSPRQLWLVAVALVVLSGCGDYDPARDEQAKAAQLEAATEHLDVDITPEVATILYGTDGGLPCAVAGDSEDLQRAELLVSHRFALQKTEVDADTAAYARAVVEVYCPDELPVIDEFIEDLVVEGTD